MKKETNFYESIVALIIMLSVGILITCYTVFAIQKIAMWFDVSLELTFRQIFGILSIIGLIRVKAKDVKEEKSGTWAFLESFLMSAFIITFGLGLAYLSHLVIT